MTAPSPPRCAWTWLKEDSRRRPEEDVLWSSQAELERLIQDCTWADARMHWKGYVLASFIPPSPKKEGGA